MGLLEGVCGPCGLAVGDCGLGLTQASRCGEPGVRDLVEALGGLGPRVGIGVREAGQAGGGVSEVGGAVRRAWGADALGEARHGAGDVHRFLSGLGVEGLLDGRGHAEHRESRFPHR